MRRLTSSFDIGVRGSVASPRPRPPRPPRPPSGLFGSYCARTCVVGAPLGRRLEVDRHER